MKTQTQRRALHDIGNDLVEAMESNHDAFLEMLSAYNIAKRVFSAEENDPDPKTLALGLQAQAMGLKTLCVWLQEIANETTVAYSDRATAIYATVVHEMQAIGIVIPDILTL